MSGEHADPAQRAGDRDRDAVTDRLRTAHAEGRLTAEEFEERVGTALAARTLGELGALTSDLPAPGRRAARTGDEATPARAVDKDHGAGLRAAWGVWATAVLVNLAVWAAVSVSAGDSVYFWPIWVAGPWGALLLARTVFGPRSGS